jgi:hypothetical protein
MPFYLLLSPSRPRRQPAPEPAAPVRPTGGTTPPAAGADGPPIGETTALRTGADRALLPSCDANLDLPSGLFG